MKQFILFVSLLALSITTSAQTPFMRHLQTHKEGKGRVVVVQEDSITEAVNSRKIESPKPAGKNASLPKPNENKNKPLQDKKTLEDTPSQSVASSTHTSGRQRYKAQGYRIQVFTGGNSRNDKMRATQVAERIRQAFPELSVYPHFSSPRWICRVGDFKDIEDANKYANLIREAKLSNEAHVVKCNVFLAR